MRKQNSMAKDLILFSLPLILSGVLQQLYNWADAFIVGHSGAEGELLLAAVGVTGPITTLLLRCIIGFTTGLAILAGQEFGQGNTESVSRIKQIFQPLLTGFFLLGTVLVIVFAEPLLRFMDTPANILDYARSYLQIVLAAMPFLLVYNLETSLLRAIGNTKIAFYSVLLSSVLNVILDILFVWVFSFGIAGAAVATAISQIAMTIYVAIYTRTRYPELFSRSTERSKKLLRSGFSFGVPPTLQNSIASFGSLILQNFMNQFGTTTVLAVTTAYRVDSLLLLPLFNMGSAISSMVARFYGEGDRKQIRQCLISGTWLIALISAVLTLAMYFFGAAFIGFFGVTGEALDFGRVFFQDVCLFYVPFGIATALRCILEGIGDLSFCSVIGIASLVVRIACSYLLRPLIGNRTVAYAEMISWIFLLVMMIFRTWQKRREIFPDKTA